MPYRVRVAVLRGGPSHEYEVSLKTGESVLKNLPPQYAPRDVLIDRRGVWHLGGVPATLRQVVRGSDVIFNALHGEYGEDGRLQSELEAHCLPYTGSGPLACAVSMKKPIAKNILTQSGIKTPPGLVVNSYSNLPDKVREIFRRVASPWVVKPADRGSSVGVSVARTPLELDQALRKSFLYSGTILVEEMVRGREATCGVIENFRSQRYYPLLPIEICPPPEKQLFDYEAKYTGVTTEICPGRFSGDEKKQLQELAVAAHRALGLRHYSRADFIVTPRRGIYLLEVNSLPGLTGESLLPRALAAVGCSYPQFLDHLIQLALARK